MNDEMREVEIALRSLDRAVPPTDQSVGAMRAAMHRARLDEAKPGPVRRALWRLPRRLTVGVAGLATLASVVGAGWSAPPGSPLHLVESTRERISVNLAGSQRIDPLLGYTEERLGTAVSGQGVAPSLAEAAGYLDEASSALPPGPSDQRSRYEHDIAELQQLQAADSGQAPSSRTASPSPEPRSSPQPRSSASADSGFGQTYHHDAPTGSPPSEAP